MDTLFYVRKLVSIINFSVKCQLFVLKSQTETTIFIFNYFITPKIKIQHSVISTTINIDTALIYFQFAFSFIQISSH